MSKCYEISHTRSHKSSNVQNSTWPQVLSNFKSLPKCVIIRGLTTSFSWLDNILNTRFNSSSALHLVFLLKKSSID